MAVGAGSFAQWAVRLEQASEAVRREATRLVSESGPLVHPARLAASDLWGGPFAEQLRGVTWSLQRYLEPWADHLARLYGALEQASRDANMAARAEAAGITSPYDVFGALAPWRAWPAVSIPFSPGWQGSGPRVSATFVYVYPDRARTLASALRQGADELRAGRRRMGEVLAPFGIDPPPFYEPMAAAAEEVAAEVLRRVEALEEADRRVAGGFANAARSLGFVGALAPPGGPLLKTGVDPADAAGSALARMRPSADVGPGRQRTQATEADPVSTATGNYLHEAVDLALPGRGLATVFARTYNSLRADQDGPLGFGWSTNLDAHLRFEESHVVVRLGDGREEGHFREATGSLTAPPGTTGRLRVEGDGFVLRSEEGVVSRFDGTGRLLRLADLSGNETVLHHDEKGRLLRVADAAGRVTSFEHDRAGRIAALVDCLGGRFEYAYDRRGNLVGITDACGGRWSYRYDDAHRMTGITDPEGRAVVTNVYDEEGRVVEQRDGAGSRWAYAYGPGRTIVTDPLGHETTYEHDARFRTTAVTDPLGATTRFIWDDGDRLIGVLDPAGEGITLAYNERGNLVEAAGPGAAPVRFEWDADDNLTAVVSAEGDRATFAYDEASRPVRLVSPAGVETRMAWRTPRPSPRAMAGPPASPTTRPATPPRSRTRWGP